MTASTIRRFEPADASWVISRHAQLYAEEAGFDASFGAVVRDVVESFVANHDPACERGWIAERGGQPKGSIFCCKTDACTAKLRLFLLEPEMRGHGLGARLLETCLGFAREAGYARLRLATHESHLAACALYARRGFTLLSARPVRNYGQDLVEQSWEIAL
ncbi:MAG: GNAT family N-acetyltransferase [Roseovarius sp.]